MKKITLRHKMKLYFGGRPMLERRAYRLASGRWNIRQGSTVHWHAMDSGKLTTLILRKVYTRRAMRPDSRRSHG